jgi:dolichol-phosphate mannosyltransferase
MDADGSHPPESVPDFLKALDIGAEMVIGSRYVRGGSTEDGWGVLRWLNSKAATLMARPFTSVRDPMSGFMALRRETWDRCRDLDPIGYKIGLELIVKSGIGNVTEVPIHFSTRSQGCSKLNASVQWQYLVHIVRLFRYKYPEWSTFLPFAAVGASGMGVYLLLLLALETWFSPTLGTSVIAAIAIVLTVIWNFTWDRLIAFWYAPPGHVTKQFLSFMAVCLVGIGINFWITTSMAATQSLAVAGLVGALVGSTAGLLFNYLCSRFLIFRRHRPEDHPSRQGR